jgi:hypothetical protein
MKLSDVINHLELGELNLSNMGGDEEDGLNPNNFGKVISYINLGLIALYTKFPVKTKELFITPVEHITNYKLHTDYLVSNQESTAPYKYLNSSYDDPFTNDLALVERVFDELGCELPLNNSACCDSLFTPSYNVLQIPCPNPNVSRSEERRVGKECQP